MRDLGQTQVKFSRKYPINMTDFGVKILCTNIYGGSLENLF